MHNIMRAMIQMLGLFLWTMGVFAQNDVEMGWPRILKSQGLQITIYQPQIEKWKDNFLEQRAAVAVQNPVTNENIFGVIWIAARTEVDKAQRQVLLENVNITKVSFPSAPQQNDRLLKILKQLAPQTLRPISLDRLQASLAIVQAESRRVVKDLNNVPPKIIYSDKPAILVLIDGSPVLRRTEIENLHRVMNTRVLMFLDETTAKYYFYLKDHWMIAPKDIGPWSEAKNLSPQLEQSMNQLRDSLNSDQQVDLLQDPHVPDSPQIFVATAPTELIQSQGPAQLEPIVPTTLLYVKNSPNDIFLNPAKNSYYVLLSGRWFKSPSLQESWAYVPPNALPTEFADIPEGHPMGHVLVSIPGTPQAKEAAISNEIPQTAVIDRTKTNLDISYDGTPEFSSIQGTPMQYAANTSIPVVRLSPSSFYALNNGVWFTSTTPSGPWGVATNVPAIIYTIPPSSPIYYATYAYVYNSEGDLVYVGYLPGYFGSYVTTYGTVIYGTGYAYRPWVGSIWYCHPWTYGFGLAWNTYGWGFHTVAVYRPWWGPWRFSAWRSGVTINQLNINHANIYNQARSLPSSRVSSSAFVESKSINNNNVYADRNGNVFRHNNNHWEQYESKKWQPRNPPAVVEQERTARARGTVNAQTFHRAVVSKGHRQR